MNSTFFYRSSAGRDNYEGGFISYCTRGFNRLTLDANFAFARSLDTGRENQDADSAAPFFYNLDYSYGTASIFDRKAAFSLLRLHDLPFGKNGHCALRYVIKGWSVAPALKISSGLPLAESGGRLGPGIRTGWQRHVGGRAF